MRKLPLKYRRIAFMLFSLFFIMLMLSITIKADDLQGYSNKIYYSSDYNIVLISPDNNRNLSIGNSYGFYLFDSLNNRTINIYINDTLIATKNINTKVIENQFYVNTTLFYLNVKINNKTEISLLYIVTPIHHDAITDKDLDKIIKWRQKEFPTIIPETLNLMEIGKLLILIIFLIIFGVYLETLFVKYIKEHKNVESQYVAETNYYQHYHRGN